MPKQNAEWRDITSKFTSEFQFRLEMVLMQITEQICKEMIQAGITRTELAERMNIDGLLIDIILDDPEDLTVKDLLKIADAMELNLNVQDLFVMRKG